MNPTATQARPLQRHRVCQDFDTPAAIWDQPGFGDEERRASLGGNALTLFDLPARTATSR